MWNTNQSERVATDLYALQHALQETYVEKRDDTITKIQGLFDNLTQAQTELALRDFLKMQQNKGDNINSYDAFGYSVLHWFVASGNSIAVEYLVAQGADVNLREFNQGRDNGDYPLHIAIMNSTDGRLRNYLNVINILLECNANMNLCGAAGYTANSLAEEYEPQIFNLLQQWSAHLHHGV